MPIKWVNRSSKQSVPSLEEGKTARAANAGDAAAEWGSIPRVAAILDVSPASVWRYIKTVPNFPQPVKLSPGCTRIDLRKLDALLRALEGASE